MGKCWSEDFGYIETYIQHIAYVFFYKIIIIVVVVIVYNFYGEKFQIYHYNSPCYCIINFMSNRKVLGGTSLRQ